LIVVATIAWEVNNYEVSRNTEVNSIGRCFERFVIANNSEADNRVMIDLIGLTV
jgi:hypothetical protein